MLGSAMQSRATGVWHGRASTMASPVPHAPEAPHRGSFEGSVLYISAASPRKPVTMRPRFIGTRVVETDAPAQAQTFRERSPSPAPEGQQRSTAGYIALFGVAVLWGSYTPAIRLLYGIDTPPDPPLLNALQACLSAAFLITANITARITNMPSEPHPERSNPLMAEDSAIREATLRRDNLQGKTSDSGAAYDSPMMYEAPRRKPANAIEHAFAEALNWRTTNLTVAGAEVGLWMCLAFGLEVAGLQLTSATKVAFLNQVSVLITPLLVHLSGERVRGLEWLTCGLGLLGSVLVAADSLMGGGGGGHGAHGAVMDAGQSNEVLGLTFVLISSVFFALSTVRLGRYSSMFDPLQLSTTSTCTLGVLSLGWVAASILGRADGAAYELTVIDNMLASTTCILTLIWVGLGPGALAAYLQATGQKSVPPAQAQVIYSTTPLWAAGFALIALDAGDEAMGGIAWVGAAIMLGSSLMTALLPAEAPPQMAAAGADDGAVGAVGGGFPGFSKTSDKPPGDGEYSMPFSHNDLRSRSPAPLDDIEADVRERQGLRDVF